MLRISSATIAIALASAATGCAAIGESSWAAPVRKHSTRMDLAGGASIADAPYDIGQQTSGLVPEAEIGFARGISEDADVQFAVRGISAAHAGLLFGGKALLVRNDDVEASLGMVASGYWIPWDDFILGSVDLRAPLRLGWNLTRGVQLGTGASLGIRYERLRVPVKGAATGDRILVEAGALRPVFDFTVALYTRPFRAFHIAPTLTWETVYGTTSAFYPANTSVFTGSLHVLF